MARTIGSYARIVRATAAGAYDHDRAQLIFLLRARFFLQIVRAKLLLFVPKSGIIYLKIKDFMH